MLAFLHSLSQTTFIPHGHCYLWKPELVGLHVASDICVALAYYFISASLFYFVHKRRDLPFSWAFQLFAVFIIACGTTHWMEIWTLWYPTYWLSGALKAITAIVSVATAVMLLPLIPKALALPSPAELETTNQKLQAEVAERQRLEKERESFFRLSSDLLCIATFDGYFQAVNPACESETGFTAAELLAHPFVNLIYPDDREALLEAAHKVISGIDTSRFESRIQCKDGSTKWIAWSASAGFDEQLVYIIGRNVTERKLVEIALRESEARFRQITETIHEVFWVATMDLTQVLYVSPAYEAIWGRTCTSLYEQPQSFIDAIHPDDREGALTTVATQRHSGFSHEFRIIRPDGSIRWIWERGFPVCDEAGNPYRLIGASQDITDRKLTEEALGLADFSFDRSAIAAVWIDSNARILRVNEGSCQMLGYSREALQSMSVYDLDPNFPREAWSEHWELLRQQQTITFVSQLQRKDGSFVPIEITANYLKFKGKEYNFSFSKDISERLQAEAVLKQQRERERMLLSVTEHIRQSLDLEEILHTAVEEVRQLLQSDRIVIYRFHADWSGTIVAESVRTPELSLSGRLIDQPCFTDGCLHTYQQGQISTIENVEDSHIQPCHRQFLTCLEARASLVVPVLHETALWGLVMAHHCSAPHAWQPWEVDSLRQLTTQLAVALQQSELYRQVQQFNLRLEQQVTERTEQLQRSLKFEALLKRITDKVRDSLEEAHILQTAVQELATELQVYSCDAGLYDLEHNTSTINYECVRCELPPACGKSVQLSDRPEIYGPLLQGNTLQFCWMLNTPSLVRPVAKQLTILACPLLNEQTVIGDLWLCKAGEHPFEELEIRLVQQVANQCAIAVRQARLYQASQAQIEELERLNHLKDDFLSTVSHELRTPVSNIKMAAQMLKLVLAPLGVLDPDSGSASRYFQILQDECQREINLINDLLDLTRLDSGSDPLNLCPIQLQFWIAHVSEPFVERTRCQVQALEIDIPDDLPPLLTDLAYLERILTELLHNACKYTPAGGKIKIAAHLSSLPNSAPNSNAMLIAVSNTGVEIPAGERDRIFDKFYRIPNKDPWKHGGTGLGLSLVKKLVQRLGGAIWIESHPALTQFVLQLPLIDP